MQQGRLITWPNALQHRIDPFTLVDAANSGHCRFITLSLVDPHYRVCSTRNVPPQRHDWWAGEVCDTLSSQGKPREVANFIIDKTSDWPIGMDEAKQAREQWTKEHKWADQAYETGIEVLLTIALSVRVHFTNYATIIKSFY